MSSHGTGVSALARQLDMPKSTIQRSLETLAEVGWIKASTSQGTRRTWEPTLRLFTLSRAFSSVDRTSRAALPHMRALRDDTGETIHLMVPEGDTVVLIERLDSTKSLRTVRPLGMQAPLHVASNGKAVLAQLTDAQIDAYLQRPIRSWTRQTKNDKDAIRRDIALIRRVGYAVSEGELDDGVHAVAAVIRDGADRPVASLSISCPAVRLPPQRFAHYGKKVKAAADAITQDLAQSEGDTT